MLSYINLVYVVVNPHFEMLNGYKRHCAAWIREIGGMKVYYKHGPIEHPTVGGLDLKNMKINQ